MNRSIAEQDRLIRTNLGDRIGALFPLLMEIQPLCSEQIWLGGGALRDIIIGDSIGSHSDVDLLFFNEKETSRNYEIEIEDQLIELTNIQNLSVKNQARMGLVADGARYTNLLQSVAAFPDVTVAIAACILLRDQTALIFAPYGFPSQDRRLIQPTARYLATHGIGAYYSWLDRKQYDRRFHDWRIDTVARAPLTSSALVRVCSHQ